MNTSVNLAELEVKSQQSPPMMPHKVKQRSGVIRTFIIFPALFFFALFMILQGIDISKDYAQIFGIALRNWSPELNAVIAPLHIYTLSLFFIFSLSVIFFRKVLFPYPVAIFMAMIFLFIGTGFFVGLLNENRTDLVFLETSNWLIYLALPFFVSLCFRLGAWKAVLVALSIFLVIILAKIFISFIIDFSQNISYLRVMVRGNFYLMPFFFVALSFAMMKRRILYIAMTVVASFAIFVSGMRGFYIGTAIGLIYFLSFKTKIKRIIGICLLLFTILMLFGLFAGIPVKYIFGFWDTTQAGIDYRIKQSDFFLSSFIESPIWGKGFGFVLYDFFDTIAFEYQALPKPYLLELEWLNFLAKTGLFGILLLIVAFITLLHWIKRVSCKVKINEKKFILQGLACGLVAMLVASFTNAIISSILFHIYVFGVSGITAGIAAESRLENLEGNK